MSDYQKRIWKFNVTEGLKGPVKQMIPQGAQVLHADLQGAKIQVWAMVNPEMPEQARYFRVYYTGDPITYPFLSRAEHVGTVMTATGARVFHVFDVTEFTEES